MITVTNIDQNLGAFSIICANLAEAQGIIARMEANRLLQDTCNVIVVEL